MAQGVALTWRLTNSEIKGFASTELARWQASQVAHFQRQQRMQGTGVPQLATVSGERPGGGFAGLQRPADWGDLLAYPTDERQTTLETVRRGGKRLARALQAWPRIWRCSENI